jgi:hypothetical protein
MAWRGEWESFVYIIIRLLAIDLYIPTPKNRYFLALLQ